MSTLDKKMKIRKPDKYITATILFFAVAVVFIAIAIITNSGDITTAAFVISGMVCAMIGIFTLAFSGGEPVNPQILGILTAQGSLNLCRITQHIGMHGNAYFLPQRVTGETRVMQFNPTSSYDGVSAKGSFRETAPAGLVTFPSCDLLIENLMKRNAFVIPHEEEELTLLLCEILEDVFKFTPRISVSWRGKMITITFHEYPAIYGCKVIAQKSPHCCTMDPCPVCSLCGALIAEGLDKVVTLDQCKISSSYGDVTAIFSILP